MTTKPKSPSVLDGAEVPRGLLWWAIAVSSLLVAAAMPRAGISVVYDDLAGMLQMLALGALLTVLARDWNNVLLAKVAMHAEMLALFYVTAFVMGVGSYAAAAYALPYMDDRLARLDASLGLSWTALYRFVAERPALQVAERHAYRLIGLSPLVILLALAIRDRAAQARQFLFAYWLALLLTILIFPLVPALGPISSLHPNEFTYIPACGIEHGISIDAARRGALGPLPANRIGGLISVPSFHAAAAMLYIWVARWTGALRWPLVALNAGMLAATPIEGNHYFVDLLAGLAVAGFAIWASAPARLHGTWRALRRLAPQRRIKSFATA